MGAIFISGYLIAWDQGRTKLKEYKYEVMVQGEIQKDLNTQKELSQKKIIDRNKDEYEKRIAAIERTDFSGLQRNTCGSSSAAASCGSDTFKLANGSEVKLPPYSVVVKNCAEDVNQLQALINIIKENQATK